jgi:predicted alpha/beta-hydrolase family hydrolase
LRAVCCGTTDSFYTIRNATGAVVARDVTLNELRDSRVDLYDQLAPLISPTNSAMATSLRAD